jgi:hypothetical protein
VSTRSDKEFEALLKDFLDEMRAVQCSVKEFAGALRIAIDELEVELDATGQKDGE